MIAKAIRSFGVPCILACDGKCEKAWGINHRPRIFVDDPQMTLFPNEISRYPIDVSDIDDHFYPPDDTLGIAPVDPGIYEDDQPKPRRPRERLNKWCARECERSVVEDDPDFAIAHGSLKRLEEDGTPIPEIKMPDYTRDHYNFHARQQAYDEALAAGQSVGEARQAAADIEVNVS